MRQLLLSWLAGGTVTPPLSTTTMPPAGTTPYEGQDASAGCPGVVVGRCGLLESCIELLHLVEGCELIGVDLDL